jgi:hypothetical protein
VGCCLWPPFIFLKIHLQNEDLLSLWWLVFIWADRCCEHLSSVLPFGPTIHPSCLLYQRNACWRWIWPKDLWPFREHLFYFILLVYLFLTPTDWDEDGLQRAGAAWSFWSCIPCSGLRGSFKVARWLTHHLIPFGLSWRDQIPSTGWFIHRNLLLTV